MFSSCTPAPSAHEYVELHGILPEFPPTVEYASVTPAWRTTGGLFARETASIQTCPACLGATIDALSQGDFMAPAPDFLRIQWLESQHDSACEMH
jgi:hypothetical protein